MADSSLVPVARGAVQLWRLAWRLQSKGAPKSNLYAGVVNWLIYLVFSLFLGVVRVVLRTISVLLYVRAVLLCIEMVRCGVARLFVVRFLRADR
ncbi:hypothetical protein [Andreprevotia lacus]|jgi:hypothetical protein|uniref:hypothetical protein n=1 Tax=Andreprevotia lacus TaxID=1121000 RepID=UPI00111C4E04|nr:hypothetical protein [Andreprevotia lacus]